MTFGLRDAAQPFHRFLDEVCYLEVSIFACAISIEVTGATPKASSSSTGKVRLPSLEKHLKPAETVLLSVLYWCMTSQINRLPSLSICQL